MLYYVHIAYLFICFKCDIYNYEYTNTRALSYMNTRARTHSYRPIHPHTHTEYSKL